jgi:hypothetical protein
VSLQRLVGGQLRALCVLGYRLTHLVEGVGAYIEPALCSPVESQHRGQCDEQRYLDSEHHG